jgi:hypothetical protein
MIQQGGTSLKINFGVISQQIAYDRYERFDSLKFDKIKTGYGSKYQKRQITFDCDAFLDFLKYNVVKVGTATGLRIYFACYAYDQRYQEANALIPAKNEGCMTIIFAPTTRGIDYDMKDSGEYFVTTPWGEQFVTIEKDAASVWVKKYRDTLWPKLSADIPGDDKETCHIWYNKAGIDATCIDIPRHNTTEITAFFGAYKENEKIDVTLLNGSTRTLEVSNQLTLTFGTDVIPMAPLKSIMQQTSLLIDQLVVAGDPENYDTGIPIPPPLGGNDGAGLP